MKVDLPENMTMPAASPEIFEQLGTLTRQLHDTMNMLGVLPGLKNTVDDLPDARSRLNYIATKTADAADRIVADARALEDAGAFAVVLEAMPPDVASQVTESVSIPTIGIGAGRGCDGQVLVCTDLLGMSRGHTPKFARRFAELGDEIVRAAASYVDEVRAGTFPAAAHEYRPSARARDDAATPRGHGGATR